jgi:hypothetical protein
MDGNLDLRHSNLLRKRKSRENETPEQSEMRRTNDRENENKIYQHTRIMVPRRFGQPSTVSFPSIYI